MQKGQATVLILVGILVIIVVAGRAYYLGRLATPKSQPQNPVAQTPQPTITAQPTLTPDETGNWKIYTNAQLGYSVKIPNYYTVSKPNSSETIGVTFSDSNKNSFRIQTYTGEYLNSYYKSAHAWWVEKYQKNITNVTIDGVPGKKFIYEPITERRVVFEMVLVEKDGKAYEFWAEINDNNEEDMKVFRNALSTFKFIP